MMAAICGPQRPASARRVGIGWSIAIAAGATIGEFASHGRPPLPPVTSQQWLTSVVVPAAVVATIAGLFLTRRSPAATFICRAAVSFGAPLLLLIAHLKYHWDTAEALIWLAVLSFAILLQWVNMNRLATRRPGRHTAVILFAIVTGTGVVIMLSDSAHIAQKAFTLAAATGGALAASFLLPRGASSQGCVGVIVTAWSGLMIIFWFYVQTDPGPAEATMVILLLAAVPAAWVGEVAAVQRLKPVIRGLTRIAAVLLPIVAAVIVAAIQFAREWNQTGPW